MLLARIDGVAGRVFGERTLRRAVVDQQRRPFVGHSHAGAESVQDVAASDLGLQQIVEPVIGQPTSPRKDAGHDVRARDSQLLDVVAIGCDQYAFGGRRKRRAVAGQVGL